MRLMKSLQKSFLPEVLIVLLRQGRASSAPSLFGLSNGEDPFIGKGHTRRDELGIVTEPLLKRRELSGGGRFCIFASINQSLLESPK